jgi:hypothetical protein
MRVSPLHLLALGLLAVASGCVPAPLGGLDLEDDEVETSALANDDPAKLLVYTTNLENLATSTVEAGDPELCRGDWQDLFYFMAYDGRAPDVVLVQQVSDEAQLDGKLIAKMEELFGEEYGSIIAEKSPSYWAAADCSGKHYQTNAIVYRKARLRYAQGSKRTWSSQVAEGDACVTAPASRYVNVAAKFEDVLRPHGNALAEVAVGSVHWPVKDGCGVTNAKEASAMMESYTGAQLWIFGGDMNLPEFEAPAKPASGWRSWYERANASLGAPDTLGWVDPVYEGCAAANPAEAALGQCLVANGTMRSKVRYDYLFAKYKPSYRGDRAVTSAPITVDPVAAGQADQAMTGGDRAELAYSMHRAVGSYFHW